MAHDDQGLLEAKFSVPEFSFASVAVKPVKSRFSMVSNGIADFVLVPSTGRFKARTS